MTNLRKRFACLLLALSALASFASVYAGASSEIKVKYFFSPVYVEGREVYVEDANGKDMEFLTYNGTTYIPLRMAGNWMGKNVVWDGTTRTVTLYGTTAKTYRTETTVLPDDDEQGTEGGGLPATLETDIQIIVDGRTRTFKNANGQTVYPISFKNTIYLPVRSIGELSGMTVNYRPYNRATGDHEAIFLRTAMTDEQIAAGETYLKTVRKCFSYDALKEQGKTTPGMEARYKVDSRGDIFEYMSECNNADKDELRTFAEIGIEQMKKILDTPKPDCPVFDAKYDEIDERAQAGKEACEKVLAALDAGEDVKTCRALMINRNTAGGAKGGATEICRRLTATCREMEIVLYEHY